MSNEPTRTDKHDKHGGIAPDGAPDSTRHADTQFARHLAEDKGTHETPPVQERSAHGRQADEMSEQNSEERVDAGVEKSVDESRRARNRNLVMGTSVALVALLLIVVYLTRTKPTASLGSEKTTTAAGTTSATATAETAPQTSSEVVLPAEALTTAAIEIAGVTQRPAVARLVVPGIVEANQQQMQQVTSLVAGRVDRVYAALGDKVRAGSLLATIASPQIAEMRGNLSAAETRLTLAERNLARVLRAENRVAVIAAKAKLDEAEATLRRTRRLIELGAGAGKDLVAAEAAYKTAKAEYDFQSNIALNREVQEAQAAVESARTEVARIRSELSALGASTTDSGQQGNPALIAVRAPVSGTVIERTVNAGAGVEAGKPLFTIANISTVWVIANVPEAQIGSVRIGAPAEIRSAALNDRVIVGRVSYIDPVLNAETRTARVRVEVSNPGERLKVGMFVEVSFQIATAEADTATSMELVVPSEAVQRIGDRRVVFIPKTEAGRFEVRDVQVGGEVEGYVRVTSGLKLGDRVVTKGSLILKSQMMKGQFGEEEEK
jgi:cobalt-zinc-cadmium efflux system membrane fusion protein